MHSWLLANKMTRKHCFTRIFMVRGGLFCAEYMMMAYQDRSMCQSRQSICQPLSGQLSALLPPSH